MALAPWKVRVTADGAGTLAAVHTTIELVDRAPNLAGIPPWAWYRGDTLQTSGDTVTSWQDLMPGARHLVPAGSGNSHRSITTIDGHDGITGPATGLAHALQADYDDYYFVDGVTIVAVCKEPDDYLQMIVGVTTGSGAVGFENLMYPTFQAWYSPTGGGELFGADPRVDGSPLSFTAWAGPVEIQGMQVYGTAWNDTSAFGEDNPWPGPWSGISMSRWLLLRAYLPDSWIAEYIVFDQVLDPDVDVVDFGAGGSGFATINQYLSSRYPSL